MVANVLGGSSIGLGRHWALACPVQNPGLNKKLLRQGRLAAFAKPGIGEREGRKPDSEKLNPSPVGSLLPSRFLGVLLALAAVSDASIEPEGEAKETHTAEGAVEAIEHAWVDELGERASF